MSLDIPFRGSLFAHDFLRESVARLGEWRDIDAAALEATGRGVFARFPITGSPNESQTEDDLIWPVLAHLGWTASLRQQNLSAAGRQDVPDGLLFQDAAAKDRANGFTEEWKRYAFGLAVVESKRWGRPLDRRSDRRGEETAPSTQMLRYLRRVDDLTTGALRWGILTNGAQWRRFCCNVWDHARESVGWTSLHGQSEHLVDQPRLTDHVALRHPPRLPLAERMHYLDTADGPPRRGEPLEPQHRPGTAFNESMVLLDDVVQILALAERRTWSEKSLVFDGLERDRVSGVLVHVHDARGRRMRRTDRLAEERDGRIPVARGPEPEIQRVTVGINAPVKIVPGPADTHVRLVDSIRIRGASQKWPAPLVDLRRIALHPSIDRRMVDTQAPLAHHVLEVAELTAYRKYHRTHRRMSPGSN